MGKSLDIWHVTLSSGPLPRLFKVWPWGLNWPHPGCYGFSLYVYSTSVYLGEALNIFHIKYAEPPCGPLPKLLNIPPPSTWSECLFDKIYVKCICF